MNKPSIRIRQALGKFEGIRYSLVPHLLFVRNLPGALSPTAALILAWCIPQPNNWELWVSVLRKSLGLSEHAWRKARKELVERGFLIPIEREIKGSENHTTAYRLDYLQLAKACVEWAQQDINRIEERRKQKGIPPRVDQADLPTAEKLAEVIPENLPRTDRIIIDTALSEIKGLYPLQVPFFILEDTRLRPDERMALAFLADQSEDWECEIWQLQELLGVQPKSRAWARIRNALVSTRTVQMPSPGDAARLAAQRTGRGSFRWELEFDAGPLAIEIYRRLGQDLRNRGFDVDGGPQDTDSAGGGEIAVAQNRGRGRDGTQNVDKTQNRGKGSAPMTQTIDSTGGGENAVAQNHDSADPRGRSGADAEADSQVVDSTGSGENAVLHFHNAAKSPPLVILPPRIMNNIHPALRAGTRASARAHTRGEASLRSGEGENKNYSRNPAGEGEKPEAPEEEPGKGEVQADPEQAWLDRLKSERQRDFAWDLFASMPLYGSVGGRSLEGQLPRGKILDRNRRIQLGQALFEARDPVGMLRRMHPRHGGQGFDPRKLEELARPGETWDQLAERVKASRAKKQGE